MRFVVVPTTSPGPKIVEAQFTDVRLTDPSDVEEWARRVRSELARFGERVDLLISLDGLHVHPAASRAFGVIRAEVLATFARHSTRYGADAWTATSVNTSRVLTGAEANIHESREAALEALIVKRKSEP